MHHGSDGLDLVKRLNALLREREEKVAEADGWVTATDPAWREDWKARKDALIADIEARGSR